MRRFGERVRGTSQVMSWLPNIPFPLAIPNLGLWLDASDLSTIIQSSGNVSQWNDKSGNNNNVTQGTLAAQPVTGSSTQNGLNVLNFNGSKGMRSANGVLNNPFLSVFVVVHVTNTPGVGVIIGLPQTANSHPDPYFRLLMYQTTTNGNRTLNTRLNGVTEHSGGNALPASMCIIRLTSESGDSFVNKSLVLNGTGTTLTYPSSVPFLICENAIGGERIQMLLAEIVAYTRTLTATEIDQVENYLQNKWGIV